MSLHPQDPPIPPGQPTPPPQETPPGNPRPEVPPPVREPGEPQSPDELPGYLPDELPVRGPPNPTPPPPPTDMQRSVVNFGAARPTHSARRNHRLNAPRTKTRPTAQPFQQI